MTPLEYNNPSIILEFVEDYNMPKTEGFIQECEMEYFAFLIGLIAIQDTTKEWLLTPSKFMKNNSFRFRGFTKELNALY